MENHITPITMTKRMWNLVRVFFLMARKGISNKRKLLLNINLLLKRGKIAGKALISNLIFHHRHHQQYPSSGPTHTRSTKAAAGEYELSCNDMPDQHTRFNFLHHHLPTHLVARKNKQHKKGNKKGHKDVGIEYSDQLFLDDESYEAVSRVLDTLALREGDLDAVTDTLSSYTSLNYPASQYSTPAYNLPGIRFGRSPRVRQLRVTDSPYPLTINNEDNRYVDEAAEEFINRFYSQLRQQRLTPGPHGTDRW